MKERKEQGEQRNTIKEIIQKGDVGRELLSMVHKLTKARNLQDTNVCNTKSGRKNEKKLIQA